VQKWQTSTITSVSQEKSKHINLEFQSRESLQFISKDHADAIVRKLESSRALSTGSSEGAETEADGITPRPSIDSLATTDSLAISNPYTPRAVDAAKSVHFAPKPLEIPPRADTPEEDYDQDTAYTNGGAVQSPDGEAAVALYDFEGDAADELSVREGEALIVLDRSNDDWWKCRNAHGAEGVVPAQYVDLETSDGEESAPPAPSAPVPSAASAGVGAAAGAAAALASRRAAEPEPEPEDDGIDSEEERAHEREREREKKEKKEREKRERREREEAERAARAEEETRLAAERKKAEEKKARAAASAREAKRQQEAQEARRREKEQAREKEGKDKRLVFRRCSFSMGADERLGNLGAQMMKTRKKTMTSNSQRKPARLL
jgi:actin cytoskeleton-regulatory complex protein SLA1